MPRDVRVGHSPVASFVVLAACVVRLIFSKFPAVVRERHT
jgi:hypothetical protein